MVKNYSTLFATGLMVVVAWLSPVWTSAPKERPDGMLIHLAYKYV